MSEVFIVGNSRSGTTMMSRSLGRHSKVYRFKELHFYEGAIADTNKKISLKESENLLSKLIWKQKEEFLSKPDLNKYKEVAQDMLNDYTEDINPHELFRIYLQKFSDSKGKAIPCEQTPRNLYFSREILDNFPDALIINMVRDPRPIMLSQKNKWKINKFNGYDVPLMNTLRLYMNYHPLTVSKMWNSAVNHSLQFKNESRFLTIKFEDFLQNPKQFLVSICNMLNIDFEEEMLQVEGAASSFKEDRNVKGFNKKKIDKWKDSNLSNTEIYMCQRKTQKLLNLFNYEILNTRVNYLRLALYLVLFPIKMSLAILLNLSRNKNIVKTIAKRLK